MPNHCSQTTEGDLNQSEERTKWDMEINDIPTQEILKDDSRYFLHQSMSTPCLDVLKSCKGSGMRTISGRYLLDFHGNNVHQVGYANNYLIEHITRQLNILPLQYYPGYLRTII